MLTMAHSREELIQNRDTLIYLLQHLGLIINRKNTTLEPTQTIELLGLVIDSVLMSLYLPQEKLQQILSQCKNLINEKQISLLDLTKLIGRLSSIAQPIHSDQFPLSSCYSYTLLRMLRTGVF